MLKYKWNKIIDSLTYQEGNSIEQTPAEGYHNAHSLRWKQRQFSSKPNTVDTQTPARTGDGIQKPPLLIRPTTLGLSVSGSPTLNNVLKRRRGRWWFLWSARLGMNVCDHLQRGGRAHRATCSDHNTGWRRAARMKVEVGGGKGEETDVWVIIESFIDALVEFQSALYKCALFTQCIVLQNGKRALSVAYD